jgi:hypothetical protein
MTPRESQRRAKQRQQSDPVTDRDIELNRLNPHQVLTFLEWCRLNRISPATGRRIRKAGKGPAFVQLSDRRVGVTIGANAKWQAARSETDFQGQETRPRAFEGRGQAKLSHQHQGRDRK